MWKFLKNLLGNFKNIGAITPSSRFLSRLIATFSDLHTKTDGNILEIGAGTGNVTKYLLDIKEKRKITSYEINKDFIEILNQRFLDKDIVIEDINFLDTKGENLFDTIVCCLPLTNFSQAMNDKIAERLSAMLRENGTLIYFEYLLFSDLKKLHKFDNEKLQEIHRETMFLNLPPARVIILKKKSLFYID